MTSKVCLYFKYRLLIIPVFQFRKGWSTNPTMHFPLRHHVATWLTRVTITTRLDVWSSVSSHKLRSPSFFSHTFVFCLSVSLATSSRLVWCLHNVRAGALSTSTHSISPFAICWFYVFTCQLRCHRSRTNWNGPWVKWHASVSTSFYQVRAVL